jgi:Growth inhibitor
VKRYEIRWANLDPTVGAEINKTRPVVIVSLDELNDVLNTVTVCL